jgi:hypothetical protein
MTLIDATHSIFLWKIYQRGLHFEVLLILIDFNLKSPIKIVNSKDQCLHGAGKI